MPSKPCRWPGCPVLLQGGNSGEETPGRETPSKTPGRRGYCQAHGARVEAAIGRGRRADSRYSSKKWRIRSRAFLTQNPECACGCGRMATDVDHIVPVEDGGAFWDTSNWQGLAHGCHSRKTRAEQQSRTFK